MAVRSSISVRQKDGTIKNIYCHWDGYILGGVGEKLLKFYNTEELANKLVDLGGISELGETLEIGEYSETEENPKTTKIFSKGESPCEVWLNLEQARWHNGQEYNYLWEGGEWSVRQYEWNGKVKENSVKDFCEWTPLLKAFEICEKSEKVYQKTLKTNKDKGYNEEQEERIAMSEWLGTKITGIREYKAGKAYETIINSLTGLGYESDDIEFGIKHCQINPYDDPSENIGKVIRTVGNKEKILKEELIDIENENEFSGEELEEGLNKEWKLGERALENSAEYIVGKIVKKIDNKAIIFENNFIGNKLIVEDTRKYEEGVIKKFYVSKQVNIDDKNQICEKVYGFDSPEEKEKFLWEQQRKNELTKQFVKVGDKKLLVVNKEFNKTPGQKHVAVSLKISVPKNLIKTHKDGLEYIALDKEKIYEYVLTDLKEKTLKKEKTNEKGMER